VIVVVTGGCDSDSDRSVDVSVKVEVIVSMVVTVSLHLYFRVWGDERGLYPTSGWCQGIQGVVSYLMLVSVNQGVVASFQL
jgi:hypothetical protein